MRISNLLYMFTRPENIDYNIIIVTQTGSNCVLRRIESFQAAPVRLPFPHAQPREVQPGSTGRRHPPPTPRASARTNRGSVHRRTTGYTGRVGGTHY